MRNMKINMKISAVAIAIFLNIYLTAQEAPALDFFHGKATNLGRSSIQSGELSFKFRRLVYRQLVVEIRNHSAHFVKFSPNDITIIGHDGSQNILESVVLHEPGRWGSPLDVKVGPMAYLQFNFILNVEVRFPAKLYYAGEIIAEISNQ